VYVAKESSEDAPKAPEKSDRNEAPKYSITLEK
jgi:hypothetical protein